MDIAIWATVLFASAIFAAIGAYFYAQNAKWFTFSIFLLAGCSLILTGTAGFYEGIEYINGTTTSENWTYAPRSCVTNTTWNNGTDTFTDNSTSTCFYANASNFHEDVTRAKSASLIANGISLIVLFTGFAFCFFSIILALKKG